MVKLDPILVESKTKQYANLSNYIQRASDLLIPDAFANEKEQLDHARLIVDGQKAQWDFILNSLSVGVIFNEAANVNGFVEQDLNLSATALLWKALDIISMLSIMSSKYTQYLESITVEDSAIWKMQELVSVQEQFDLFVDKMEMVADLILSVLNVIS